MLVGRSAERTRLARLIADAKAGRSGSLVLRGEAGIGKTALLGYAADIAAGMRVLRVVGVESEAEIPFAGLQLMFARFADRFDALPGPQGQALRAAFGASFASGERLLVGAAILTLLSELAEDGPLLCLIDDVHWFDQSSIDALLFALRRLHTDPVATIFAARDGDRPFPAAGIDSTTLRRLGQEDCARLLASVRTLPNEIADRVITESGGNPLAILELAATDRTAAPPVAPLPAAGRLEERFREQIRALPERTRLALLLAAADHTSELGSFSAAAARLVTVRAIPDHVEAGIRAGDVARARRYLPQLIDWATHTASPVAHALVLRCEALLAEGADAQQRFEAALRLSGCGPYDQARTRLAYGEWLRRHRRRTAARAQLVEALDTFERIAAHGWQRRVRTELIALGDPVPDSAAAGGAGTGQLTPQELQVVRRAAFGMSNREIGAELFLSPRTVGHHLYKAYPKLGVSRRAQLAQLDL